MKKQYFLMAAIILISLMFGSWVDPRTIDTYEGEIYIYDKVYDVSDLSGDIEFFLHSYDGLILDTSGYIYNSLGSAITGRALINGTEYNIRIDSFGGLAIQQSYYQNNYERTTWQTYHLIMDNIPGHLSFDNTTNIIVLITSLSILLFTIVKVFTK